MLGMLLVTYSVIDTCTAVLYCTASDDAAYVPADGGARRERDGAQHQELSMAASSRSFLLIAPTHCLEPGTRHPSHWPLYN